MVEEKRRQGYYFPLDRGGTKGHIGPMATLPTFCPHCGKSLPPVADIHFCPHCGRSLAAAGGAGYDRGAIEARILPLLHQGKTIEAIKLFRQLTGLGLREAKDQVDAIAAQNHLTPVRRRGGLGCGSVLLFSLFVGFMLGTAGIAVFPSIGKIAGPFLCDGSLALQSNHYTPSPGTSVTTRHFYCADNREVTFRVAFLSAALYSALVFILSSLILWIGRAGRKDPSDAIFDTKPPPGAGS